MWQSTGRYLKGEFHLLNTEINTVSIAAYAGTSRHWAIWMGTYQGLSAIWCKSLVAAFDYRQMLYFLIFVICQ